MKTVPVVQGIVRGGLLSRSPLSVPFLCVLSKQLNSCTETRETVKRRAFSFQYWVFCGTWIDGGHGMLNWSGRSVLSNWGK